MRSLASAIPSIRRSARSAPNIRNALSDLLAQSGGEASDLPDQAQIPIGRYREQRGVPQPQADNEYERADQGNGLEDTAAGPDRSLLCLVVHGRVNDSIDRLSHPAPPAARDRPSNIAYLNPSTRPTRPP